MKMYSITGATSLSWNGNQFDADANGGFEVPDEAVVDLASFGVLPGEAAPSEPANVVIPVSQWRNVDLLAKAEEIGLELPPDIKRPALIQAVAAALSQKAAE